MDFGVDAGVGGHQVIVKTNKSTICTTSGIRGSGQERLMPDCGRRLTGLRLISWERHPLRKTWGGEAQVRAEAHSDYAHPIGSGLTVLGQRTLLRRSPKPVTVPKAPSACAAVAPCCVSGVVA